MARNGNIIISHGLKIDKEHKNILNYSTSTMLSLMQSNDHLSASDNKYSFVRDTSNQVDTNFNYGTCLLSNYMAFQNPNYSNKWFFSFITKVIYVSDAVTRLEFEVDDWQTWFDNLTFGTCFVEREHVNDDTTGLHTIPEGLETGEYIVNLQENNYFNDLCFLVNVSEWNNGTKVLATSVNGVYMSGGFYVFDNIASMVTVFEAYTKDDVIKQVYMVPKFLLGVESYNTQWQGKNTPTYFDRNISVLNTIDGYTPVNNKLKCYPYRYLLETNNNGSSSIFRYENFTSTPVFSIGGVATVGASITSTPTNYKEGNENNMLIAGKFPTCSWSEDAYTNWLTMNAVNVLGNTLNAEEAGLAMGASEIGLGTLSMLAGNPYGIGGAIGGVGTIFETMKESYRHKLIPDSFKGNINGGDSLTANGKNGFVFYHMSIKGEYARIIDQYFTRYGYKVNTLKVPNIIGRSNWNYVKIGAGEELAEGNISVEAMDSINNIFRKGVTVWHNHANIGNFNLSNNIVS